MTPDPRDIANRMPRTALSVALLLGLAGPARAAETEPFSLFEEEARVIVASRRLEPLREAPANVTVITADQIRGSGARTLAEVLALIPGVQITTHRKGDEKIWIRGVTSAYNDKTILLIDGYPFKELVYGQHPISEQVPLADIKRVEIIKGPGSVVYGANAFSGVINIITQEPNDVRQNELRAGYGSWNTQDHSLLLGKGWDRGGAVFAGAYYDSKGSPHDKDADGNATTRRYPHKLTSSNLRLVFRDFTFGVRYSEYRSQYMLYSDLKTTNYDNKTTLLSLGWHKSLHERLTLSAKLYCNYFDWGHSKKTVKTDGMSLSKLEERTEQTRAAGGSLQAEATAWESHNLVLGVDVDNEKGLVIRQLGTDANTANPAPALTRGTDPAQPEHNNVGLFLEDSWKLHPRLKLIGGLRRDFHSRYSGFTSPRAALVAEPMRSLNVKLMYGRAFRAPSFRELYIWETADVNGDPGLKPEEIDTWELLTNYQVAAGLTATVSLFLNDISDFITPDIVQGKYVNAGSHHIRGIESQLRWQASPLFSAFANHTLLRAVDANGNDVGGVAKEMFNLGADVKLAKHWRLNTTLNHLGRRSRPSDYQVNVAASKRENHLGAYQRVNLTLSTMDFPLDFSVSVYNLFDVRSYNPNHAEGAFDIQHPQRSIRASATYKF